MESTPAGAGSGSHVAASGGAGGSDEASPSPAAYDVWIDEVAFDDERIGCVR